MTFTAHNIRLADGSETFPEAGFLIADSPLTKAVMRSLGLVYGDQLAGRSIVDLGCLEGGYAVEFARAGMRVTGVEVRQTNFDNCLRVQNMSGVQDLQFVKDDVWNLESIGQFDAAFCCGLLYHLEEPVRFISMLSRCVKDVIILQTHVAIEQDNAAFALSPMSENENFPGRWYQEHDIDDVAKLEEAKWTSWSNKKSFWLTKPALIQVIKDCGFSLVYEQFDTLGGDIRGSMESGYYHQQNRGMFVGIRR